MKKRKFYDVYVYDVQPSFCVCVKSFMTIGAAERFADRLEKLGLVTAVALRPDRFENGKAVYDED